MTAPPPKDRLTLALNAAENMLQLAFADAAGQLVYSKQITAASRGAEILAPALDSSLALLGKKTKDIARVAAVVGPGSFTGIRLVIATAAGIARAVGAEQAPLDHMHLVARQCLPFLGFAAEDAQMWVLTRARRDLVYIQGFIRDNGKTPSLVPLGAVETACISSGQAATRILDMAVLYKSERILLAGSGVAENRHVLVKHLAAPGTPRMTILPVTSPAAETLVAAALEAPYGTSDLDPLYVRVSDAEENLPRIAATLGLNPAEAVERLKTLTTEMPEA